MKLESIGIGCCKNQDTSGIYSFADRLQGLPWIGQMFDDMPHRNDIEWLERLKSSACIAAVNRWDTRDLIQKFTALGIHFDRLCLKAGLLGQIGKTTH